MPGFMSCKRRCHFLTNDATRALSQSFPSKLLCFGPPVKRHFPGGPNVVLAGLFVHVVFWMSESEYQNSIQCSFHLSDHQMKTNV